MSRSCRGLRLAALATFLVLAHLCTAQDTAGIPPSTGDSLIVFLSDTQSPLFVEEFRIAANRNEEARDLIFKEILAIHPNAIIHLGDLVSLGFYPGSWEAFDDFLVHARRQQIPLYPTLGNHELLLFSSYGLSQFLKRFPWYPRTGYVTRIGRLGIVQLNSNFPDLTEAEQQDQLKWLEKTLLGLEADTAIGTVIIGCHHPPFTNSTIVDPSEDVQNTFVPLFLRFGKCRLFVSGHSHACEHFVREGKDFLVIGGGGGLQHPLLKKEEERYQDVSGLTGVKRMFHFLQCRVTETSVLLSVRMVRDDFSGFETIHEFTLPLFHGRFPAVAQ